MIELPKPPKSVVDAYDSLSDWCILHAYRGSIAHGTYIPNHIDDIDTMAICVPPNDYYYGLRTFGSRGTQEIAQDQWDIVVYEARKAIGLLKGGNPNVLSLLWLDSDYYFYTSTTNAGEHLIANRDMFAGKHVYNAFTGYARGQLKRMEKGAYQGYMGVERKAIVDQFGFDTKHGSHCIRLLRMGVEFLLDGRLNVHRHNIDAQELIDIKQGKWSLDEVKECAEDLFQQSRDTLVVSPLPDRPDFEKINALCTEVVYIELERRRRLDSFDMAMDGIRKHYIVGGKRQ